MSVDRDRLEVILSEFPRQELSKIADEKEVKVEGRSVEDYVEAIKQATWTTEQTQNLVGRLQRVSQESESMGFYICVIEDHPDLGEFAELLEKMNPAKFNDNGEPIESGYDIDYVNNSELSYREWKVSEKNTFERITGQVKTYDDISMVSVDINTEKERVYINTKNYLKAKSVRGFLKEEGFELGEIGHKRKMPEDAKESVKSFVNELEQELEEVEDE